jgi:iron-sulfur cluster assembly accessory protein
MLRHPRSRLKFAGIALNYSPGGLAIEPIAGRTGEAARMDDVTITERATRQIRNVLRREPPGAVLRVSVEGGGCSGFQYKFDVDHAQTADDVVIGGDDARVVIDQVSLRYLAGAQIDFVDDLIGAAFRINNPQAKASCGCGTSFAL